MAQPLCGRDLATVVKLGFDAGDQLVGQVANPDSPRRLHAPVELPGDARQHGRVSPHDLIEAGTLDLDDHRAAVVQSGSMGLTDRRGRDGLGVKFRKRLLDRLPLLGLQSLGELVAWPPSHVGVQV